jgi:outer membrane receptor protein involved in Fe transport
MSLKSILLYSVATFAISPSLALAAPAAPKDAPATAELPTKAAPAAPAEEVFSTGVAKGRDRLDSATSTSALKESEIRKVGAHSLGEILRNIPGIRTEASTGDGNSNYTIRGLPLASGGSKFMQIEEDGLPVLEFGDFFNVASDIFIRFDSNVAAVEAIRGGSASTFASNSPGGVINLISKTGDVEGGEIQATTGVTYDEKRLDFDYGAKITDTLRYHFGGFYRTGEGPRHVGFNAFSGGQLKFNITQQLSGGGYIRLSAKYLDDRSPQYMPGPVRITGTNDKPSYGSFPSFDIRRDSVLSGNITSFTGLGENNLPTTVPFSDGMHAVVKSVGLESQFDVSGWSITERGRYSQMSGSVIRDLISNVYDGNALPATLGAGTGTLSYASGPNAGQVITKPGSINGNGLIASDLIANMHVHAVDNFTNDLRANRSFKAGDGELTLTGGVYNSVQKLNTDWLYGSILQDLTGDGNSSLINYTNAAGVAQTQNGVQSYALNGASGLYRRTYNLQYGVTAPYGSINYHLGKIAIGASVRYDIGKVNGDLVGSDLGGGRVGITSYDFNGDGKISVAESKTAILPITQPAPVNYDYHYASYSVGVNYRVAEPLAVFARYSVGARANADKILFANTVSTGDGSLLNASDGYDKVKQSEAGLKFRKAGFTLNATQFLADTGDTNLQSGGIQTHRQYRAYGTELETGYRYGPFSVTGGATYTHATIESDTINAAVAGKVPRHQPKFIFSLTPQYETRKFTVGANIVGNTESYAQDTNLLKMPGYTVVNAFFQYRPIDRLEVMVNVNNLFDTVGFFEVAQSAVPANGIGSARSINGRTISTSLRLTF